MVKNYLELMNASYNNGFYFEKYILSLLRLEMMSLEKPLIVEKEINKSETKEDYHKYVFDAVAPEGIYDVRKTYIEIKYYKRSTKELNQFLERELARIRYQREPNSDCKYLLIVPIEISDYSHLFDNYGFEIWGIDKVNELAAKHPLETNAYIESVLEGTKVRPDSFENYKGFVSEEEIEKQNKIVLNELLSVIGDKQICLVLGAGVSYDFNGLTWSDLVDGLYNSLDGVKKFNDSDTSFSILGGSNESKSEYARHNLKKKYLSALSKLLYPKRTVRFHGKTSLEKCAELITHQKRPIKKVITYNYDNYLEQVLDIKPFEYNTLFSNEHYLNRFLPIYHVHGFLPRNRSRYTSMSLEKSIVLTEEEYYSCYSNSSSWQVAIQLETFKDDICLFVGNSISDLNERRLLNATKQNNKNHFAIICSKGLNGYDISKLHYYFSYLLNIDVIWAKDIIDIPVILSNIVSSL